MDNKPTTTTNPANAPESAEVSEARQAEQRRRRLDLEDDTVKILTVDVKNSCDALAHAVRARNPTLLKTHRDTFNQRVETVAANLGKLADLDNAASA